MRRGHGASCWIQHCPGELLHGFLLVFMGDLPCIWIPVERVNLHRIMTIGTGVSFKFTFYESIKQSFSTLYALGVAVVLCITIAGIIFSHDMHKGKKEQE